MTPSQNRTGRSSPAIDSMRKGSVPADLSGPSMEIVLKQRQTKQGEAAVSDGNGCDESSCPGPAFLETGKEDRGVEDGDQV